MPKGFLVKRTRKSPATSTYRTHRCSDDDRSDSGSDLENYPSNFGSPDSGYSRSPANIYLKDTELFIYNHRSPSSVKRELNFSLFRSSAESTPASSPLTVSTAQYLPVYPSPLYFSAFDRLTVSSDSPGGISSPKLGTAAVSGPSSRASTPSSPNKKRSNSDTIPTEHNNSVKQPKTPNKKPKAARRINFDDDKSSPVSGTIIKDLSDTEDEGIHVVSGDIDSAFNVVEATPEARAELDKIENKIGDYNCQLCREHYDDAFQLAQHRCSRIVHVEYRCPECDKVFNCPANLASHRRWHKPRAQNTINKTATPTKILPATTTATTTSPGSSPAFLLESGNGDLVAPTLAAGLYRDVTLSPSLGPKNRGSPNKENGHIYECEVCGKKFRRHAYLRKHLACHEAANSKNNVNMESSLELLSSTITEAVLSMNHHTALQPTRQLPQLPDNHAHHEKQHQKLDNGGYDSNSNKQMTSPHAPMQTMPEDYSLTRRDIHVQEHDWPGIGDGIDTNDLICSMCRAAFSTTHALDKHMRVHHHQVRDQQNADSRAPELLPCKYCTSTFYTSPALTRHINKCHPSENRDVIMLQVPVSRPC